MRRVVVTGFGLSSCLSSNRDEFWELIKLGRSGISRIDSYELLEKDPAIAGQIRDLDLEEIYPKRLRRCSDRFTQLALYSAQQAFDYAGLFDEEKTVEKEACGVFVGTGIGGIGSYEGIFEKAEKSRFIDPLSIPRIMNNAAAGIIANELALRGPNLTFNTACSSAANAIGTAFQQIRSGYLKRVVCCGTEAPLAPRLMRTWSAMSVLSKAYETPERASRPFDRHRDGLVMSEGAASLILEDLESAEQRGAEILGEVLGFSSLYGGSSLTAPCIDTEAEVMRRACVDAGISTEQIGYINAHGTSTKANDSMETQAIKLAFADRASQIPISSSKGALGHSLGASAAFELIICLLALREQIVPPTANYRSPDPECDLDYVPERARHEQFDYALSNSFAFGGNNVSLVIGRGE